MTTDRFGIKWRWSLYRQYLFYLRTCRNYREVIRFLRSDIPFDTLHLRNGLQLCIPGDVKFSLVVFREIWQEDIYLNSVQEVMPQYIIDIGAHAGFFAAQAAVRWPHAEIVAVEPAPENFASLKRNVQVNRLQNIRPIQAALSEQNTTSAAFQLSQQAECHALVGQGISAPPAEIITVPTISIFELIAQQNIVDLLKVDCEGCEFELIKHATDLLQATVRVIVMEYHLSPSTNIDSQLVEPLQRAGFNIRFLTRGDPCGVLQATNTNQL